MIGVFVFPLCLLLPSVGGSEFPDFGDDYDYYEDYYVCEGDACARRTIDLGFDKTIRVPNKTVTFEEYEYFYVDTAGLLADCAPSLSVGDIATTMKSCKEGNWKYQDACLYRKKGWLGQDGKSVNESVGTDFKGIEGVSENIMKCLDWDGVDDYDYDDYYDYYWDEMGLEESDEVQVRAKRDQKSNVPEFMIQKTRLKRSTDEKANIRKRNNRRVKKKGNKKRKNKGKFGRKPGKKGNKSGKKGKKHGPRRKQSARKGKKGSKFRQKSGKKSGKGRRNSGKRKHKGAKKANKRKKNGQNKKGNNKTNENKKKKEERKKKKKERKLLKELGYDSMPSKEILNKLGCVERAIQYGLEKCGEKIFKNLGSP